MRALIQRVTHASVTIDGKPYSSIQKGIVVLVGIEPADNMDDITWLSSKIINLRIMNDAEGVMNISVKDASADILVVSQFTLFASTIKGNRPSYIRAAKPETAIPLYEQFIQLITSQLNRPVSTGVFGASMQVQLTNDGPVTIWIDSKNKE
ncbi:MAG: D-aminoacyl-tRNA deacylase [Bacteroidia bacterium]|jgi:D-tyrosyl-tRNA(Tyr) deacylase|nr:D-aminoacyl-tRNA deacylase [Bacteroidia bacterium]